MQPGFQIIEDRFCPCLPQRHARLGRFAPRLFFHGIEFRDPPDCFLGNGIALRCEDIDELAAHMGHAGHLISLVMPEQPIEAGVSIRVNPTFVACKMAHRMFALSINGELIPSAGR